MPSVTLGKEHSAKISSAKGSLPSAFFRTLGKDFAECQKNTRQRKTLGKLRIEKIKKKQQKHFLNSRNNSPTLPYYHLLPYPLPYHFSLLF
jgi:hypothetical protein